MKILVQQQELLESLEIVSKAISSAPQLPVLGALLIKTNQNTIDISATDLYFGANGVLSAQVEKSGAVAVPGKEFKKIIASLNSGTIVIEKTNKTTLEIKSDGSSFCIQIIDESEFPEFPKAPIDDFLISTKDMGLLSQLVVKSASNDQTRPVLTAMLLSQQDNECCAACTDGFRLSKLNLPPVIGQNKQLLIPARVVSEVVRTAQKQNINNIKIASSNESKQAVFTIGKFTFYSRLIDGEFPPYKKIIPNEASTTAIIDVDELLENIKRTALLADKQQSITYINIKQKQVEIAAKSSGLGSYKSVLSSANVTGVDISIAFNTQYVMDFLLAVKDAAGENNQIKIECSEPTKPALFYTPAITQLIYVAMPFRVV